MKFKIVVFILFNFLFAKSLTAGKFYPLNPNDCPSEKYPAKFSQKFISDQDAINEGIINNLFNQEDVNYFLGFPREEIVEKQIRVTYQPGYISPYITQPQESFIARENLILDQFMEISWYKTKELENLPNSLRCGIYSVSIPKEDNEYTVGQFEIHLLDAHSYINHVRKIRNQGIKKTCLKNLDLMKVFDTIFNGSNKEVSKILTQDTVSEVAKLLQAIFSGRVQRHPKDGVFLTIQTPLGTLKLPTIRERQKELYLSERRTLQSTITNPFEKLELPKPHYLREKRYRSHIRALLKDYLIQGGVKLSLDKRYLVVEPANK